MVLFWLIKYSISLSVHTDFFKSLNQNKMLIFWSIILHKVSYKIYFKIFTLERSSKTLPLRNYYHPSAYPFAHSVNKYLLNIYYMPESIFVLLILEMYLWSWKTVSCYLATYILMENLRSKMIWKNEWIINDQSWRKQSNMIKNHGILIVNGKGGSLRRWCFHWT